MSTPPVTLSLMVTNAEELATMLAVLRQHDQRDNDRVKHANAERDEAMANATGWMRSAEQAQDRFISAAQQVSELTQHSESLAQQLETATSQLKAALGARDAATMELARLRGARDRIRDETARERDHLSELLQAANEKLDGGKNQPVQPVKLSAAERAEAQRRDNDAMARAVERHRLLGGVADLHPDEDPRDHEATIPANPHDPASKQCESTAEIPNRPAVRCTLERGHSSQHWSARINWDTGDQHTHSPKP